MPVVIAEQRHFNGSGTAPGAPTNVTSITKDAGATISFLPPASAGSSSVTSYTVTPYIGASAQSTTTVNVGSLGSITNQSGTAFKQATVTGLTNSTAYTFTVKATNSQATGPESTASGANTPLANLVFGDDFNGAARGDIDPEWYVYNNRCGYLGQSEVAGYMGDHCILDGSGNLQLKAEHVSVTVPRYPSDPSYPGNITQPWTSGACQSNTRTYVPAGTSMTFEVRQQICTDAGNGFWPGLFWLEGQNFLTQWKTDPNQPGWDNGTSAEIDVAEWSAGQTNTNYGVNVFGNTSSLQNINTATNFSAAMHIYQAIWTPGTSVVFKRDGTQTGSTVTTSGIVATSTCHYFLLLYLQMLAGGPTTTESCLIDYVRVFDNP